jgi:hypothetical protein
MARRCTARAAWAIERDARGASCRVGQCRFGSEENLRDIGSLLSGGRTCLQELGSGPSSDEMVPYDPS